MYSPSSSFSSFHTFFICTGSGIFDIQICLCIIFRISICNLHIRIFQSGVVLLLLLFQLRKLIFRIYFILFWNDNAEFITTYAVAISEITKDLRYDSCGVLI